MQEELEQKLNAPRQNRSLKKDIIGGTAFLLIFGAISQCFSAQITYAACEHGYTREQIEENIREAAQKKWYGKFSESVSRPGRELAYYACSASQEEPQQSAPEN